MNSIESRAGLLWAGRVLSVIVVLVLVADAAVDLFAPGLIQAEMAATGFPAALATPLGVMILICAAVYAVPRTSPFGAILITGFLGGAICTHVRLGEIGSPPQLFCVVLGMAAWGGLFLRDPRVRSLIPLRA